jgi:hypothetical protein
MTEAALSTLIAKEEIRELVLLYCRAIDRQDIVLCRSLYTADGWDTHGDNFDGTADQLAQFLETGLKPLRYSGHHICNHLISVENDTGEGEVYAIAYHILPDGKGGLYEDVMRVRYLDDYRKESGRWRFARRFVTFDSQTIIPLQRPESTAPDQRQDPSYAKLKSPLFARGPRG